MAGCDALRIPDACSTGVGLRSSPLNGEGASPLTLSLIFDGGPTETTRLIADVLAAHNAPSAFFVEGKKVPGFAADLLKMKEQGHLIGNGGYSGKKLTDSNDPVAEVSKTDELIAKAVSGDIFLLRVPGELDKKNRERLVAAGLGRYVGPIGADMGAVDSDSERSLVDECTDKAQTSLECSQRYIELIRSKDHGVVLFSGESALTVEVLKDLLPRLKDEGFSFERLDGVPSIRQMVTAVGGKPGTVGGDSGCQEYSR